MDFVPVPGHSSPQALKQKKARCAAGRWCCQARVLAVSQPTCRAGLLLFLWLLDALQFGAWAPGLSLSHTGLQTFSRWGHLWFLRH